MDALCLFYLHEEAGLPFRQVAGLSLLTRAVLVAQKAGVGQLVIALHEGDIQEAEALLKEDERVQISTLFVSGSDATLPESVSLLSGASVFIPSLLGEDSPLPMVQSSALPFGEGSFPKEDWPADRWAPVTLNSDSALAEKMLIRSLTKSADGVISRHINRKISGAVSRVLAPTSIRPNMVTAVVALIGFAALPLAMAGTYECIALAAFCYYFSAILDGVDGELSRLKFQGADLGAWLDTLTDDAVCVAYLLGLFHALSHGGIYHDWTLWTGVTIGSFMLTVGPRYYLMLTSVGAGDHQKIAAARKGGEKGFFGKIVDVLGDTVFRTDFLPFFAFVTALLDIPWFFAISFGIGSILAMFETFYTVWKFKSGSASTL